MNCGSGIRWVDVSSPDASAVEVARLTLQVRLEYVQEMLCLAACEFPGDREHVHRLRVGCRRASAALEAFCPLMGSKPKSLRNWLRRIRRAAGPARETDVLCIRFENLGDSEPVSPKILKPLRRDRKKAQRAIVKIHSRAKAGKWQRSVEKTLESLADTSSEPFRTFATASLDAISREFLKHAEREQPTTKELHKLRIVGKRLRYSIELFHSAFSPPLRQEAYPQVEQLQSRLGKINDHVSAQALFQRWLATMSPDCRASHVAQQVVYEHHAALRAQSKFFQWWTVERRKSLETLLSVALNSG